MTEPDDHERRERAAILARRQRFVAAALSGITTSTLATACACLKVATVESPAAAPDAGESEADDLTPVEDGGAAEEGEPGEEEAPTDAEAPDDVAAADSAQ